MDNIGPGFNEYGQLPSQVAQSIITKNGMTGKLITENGMIFTGPTAVNFIEQSGPTEGYVQPESKPKTNMEWLRDSVAETCALARI